MIYIGLAGWGDHESLYKNGVAPKNKLREYAGHFPIVEVDASFYAIQPEKNAMKWVEDTTSTFQFIVKAYQGMTGHERGSIPYQTKEEMFQAFIQSLIPYQKSKKLAMVLFQFPPWFECTKANVNYLRYCKQLMGEIPLALEFRHQSWFTPQYKDGTLHFMKEEGWIHSICDEPQAGNGSIPTILTASQPDKTLVRFHGRNVYGWKRPKQGDWREVRYLYRYNQEELMDWKEKVLVLTEQSKDVYIIFNNNSGGDAADNAKQFMELLGVEYEGLLAPRQLDLF
ncbi:DUF72 domain-containing protein [Heyndrickxia camelliae]|uniref:DUF72 domain-containing protein n=1 Tax=Heyndrickxia camelliae TaxID=1707093 RepID=A0A2N3LH44_9BACI|nr:DUF72 domain-containing protein [Heyndrickxia camelliae]PKR83885.1 DUF72 domain-containing protein [Heyndrickxia camelliae]